MKSMKRTKSTNNIFNFFEKHKNELVIDCFVTIQRLIEVTEDDEDCYWHLINLHGESSYQSCVGGLIVLKNRLDNEDYQKMDQSFSCMKEMRDEHNIVT